MYNDGDKKREFNIEEIVLNNKLTDNGRTEWRRDYARLLHAPSFRRLQGKTQLYPGNESDFFRNRLTHSLEVAQIAKSIAITINEKYKNKNIYIEPDICEFAGLAHDLGHPPFGHQGERALDECMRDFGGFEGNAQTLRILSRIEKKIKNEDRIEGKEFRHGLNLTYRALASILKYDNEIPFCKNKRKESEKNKPVKGYYATESDLVSKIKANVVGADYIGKFKTIECQIMDIADDIAYSTFDLEDGFKAGFYHPMDLLNLDNKIYMQL